MEKKINKYLVRIKNGDIAAFDDLYSKTAKGVYFMALSVLKDKGLAEEIMQDTFVSALKNIASFDESKNGMNWLLTISKNLAINLYNKKKRELITEPSEIMPEKDYRISDGGLIDLAIKNLKEVEFTILTLCEIKGYKRREVAQMLDMPIGTVSWHYNQALKKLKEILAKEENL